MEALAACACLHLANPTEDMLSVLVFAEIDGDKLTDEEIFAGFLLLMIAGSHQGHGTQGLANQEGRQARAVVPIVEP